MRMSREANWSLSTEQPRPAGGLRRSGTNCASQQANTTTITTTCLVWNLRLANCKIWLDLWISALAESIGLKFYHNLTPLNVTSKLTTLPRHKSHHLATTRTFDLIFLNSSVLWTFLHYIFTLHWGFSYRTLNNSSDIWRRFSLNRHLPILDILKPF